MYSPKPNPVVSKELQGLADWMQEELQAIARAMGETTELELRPSTREPEKPREGMIVYADGANWDPGEGAGSYQYVGGVWVLQRSGAEPNSYGTITDGTTPAPANSAGATFKVRSGDGIEVVTQNDDATHGDNAKFNLRPGILSSVTPVLADKLIFGDTSNSDLPARTTIQLLLDLIGSLTTEASPDLAADFLPLFDTSGAIAKKITPSLIAGRPTLISSQNLSGATTTVSIPTGYRDIEVRFNGLSTSGAVQPTLRFSEDGGSTFLASPGTLFNASNNTTGSSVQVITASAGNASYAYTGVWKVHDYLNALGKLVIGHVTVPSVNISYLNITQLVSTAPIDALQFGVVSGTFDAGVVELWGLY